MDVEPHRDPGGADPVDQRWQGAEAGLRFPAVGDAAAEYAEKAAHLGQRGPANGDDLLHGPGAALRVPLLRGDRGLGLRHHDRQAVRDHVVQLPCDPGPLRGGGQRGALALLAFQVLGALLEDAHLVPATADAVAKHERHHDAHQHGELAGQRHALPPARRDRLGQDPAELVDAAG